MKVLVTGATGLVGSRYIELSEYKDSLLTPDINALDITNNSSVERYFSKNEFDAVVNFAAFTDVKKAEEEKGSKEGLCYKLNVEGVQNLLKECLARSIFFVQISTDLVFEGFDSLSSKYTENDMPTADKNKVSWYGYTKGLAENIVRDSGASVAICRIAYPFSSKQYHLKNDLAHNILNLYKNNNLYPLFSDNAITPTYIEFMTPMLDRVVGGGLAGTFHFVLDGSVSHYEFARTLLDKLGFNPSVVTSSSMKEFLLKSPIPRAINASLSTEKTSQTLKMKTKNIGEALNDFTSTYESTSTKA